MFWQTMIGGPRGGMRAGWLGLLILALVVAGCASNAAPASAPAAAPAAPTAAAAPAASNTEAPQLLPATGATSTPAEAATGEAEEIKVATQPNFGKFLVDGEGMTLYLYTKDTPNTSNCYDKCAAAWPPVITSGAPQAGEGLNASLLGTTTRKDGKVQVTYNGNPLYYFAKDKNPGDITGQGVGGVWFVLSPRGTGMTNAKAPRQAPGAGTSATTPQAQAAPAAAATPAGPATLKVGQTADLGQFLVDDKGMTLYLYTKDAPNVSNCYDKCATAWPPLYTSGAPVAGPGVDASLLGTTTRKDGTVQVTYKGWPLYYWFKDQKPGDTTGQWVGNVWFVISPKGETITAGKPAPAAAPTAAPAAPAQPSYGGYGYGGQASGGSAPAAAAAPATAVAPAVAAQASAVDIKNFAFAPKVLTISAGTTVQWTNDDSAAHTVTADDGSFDSGNMNQGATFKFTFSKPGTYNYYCAFHGGKGGAGMAGQIVVN